MSELTKRQNMRREIVEEAIAHDEQLVRDLKDEVIRLREQNKSLKLGSTYVELLSPSPGDYLIFYIDCGKLRPTQMETHMKRVKESMSKELDDSVKYIFLPRRDQGGSQVATMSIDEMRDKVNTHDKLQYLADMEPEEGKLYTCEKHEWESQTYYCPTCVVESVRD